MMRKEQFIVNVDNIISITLYQESKCNYYCAWFPATTKMISPKWWKKPIETIIPGYYKGNYKYYKSAKDAIDSMDRPGKYKIEMLGSNIGKMEQGPDGTILENCHACVKSIGGKYVEEHTVYFDNSDEMAHWIQELMGKYPDKFTIIKGN
jgi:hypothetical protein